MVNPQRGEIHGEIDGKAWTLCLTLGALASLEERLEVGNLARLADKFSSGTLSASELIKIITAGLNGGGHDVSEEDVSDMRMENGLSGFVDLAARLLTATFEPVTVSTTTHEE